MRQVGLALHSYHEAKGFLPYASAIEGSDSGCAKGHSDRPRGTWISFILPYLEQQNVYDMIDFDVSLTADVNRTAVTTVIPTLICPTDPQGSDPLMKNRSGEFQPYHNPPQSLGLWYAASMGPVNGTHCSYWCDEPAPSYCCFDTCSTSFSKPSAVGMFNRSYHTIKFAHVHDGLSNTFMVGENAAGTFHAQRGVLLEFPYVAHDDPAKHDGRRQWDAPIFSDSRL